MKGLQFAQATKLLAEIRLDLKILKEKLIENDDHSNLETTKKVLEIDDEISKINDVLKIFIKRLENE